jgi:hypothetical protein
MFFQYKVKFHAKQWDAAVILFSIAAPIKRDTAKSRFY